jgi:hypothetical protein
MAYGADCGVFTTLSGSAPNRTFKIEWRARDFASNHETIDYELRLYENSDDFDFVYGFGIFGGYLASVGIQNGTSQYTNYSCDTTGYFADHTIHWTPQAPATCQPTQTPTAVTSPTHTPTPTATPTCEPSWIVSDHPSAGPGESQFNAVAVISANDVWAVGYYGDSNNYYRALTEHWNGTAWSVVSSPNAATYVNVLSGVSALAPDDVWAVGWYGTDGANTHTLTMHWDGTQWSIVSSPTADANSRFEAVVAISTNDVWAVGYSSSDAYQAYSILAMHWDGTVWSVITTPDVGTQTNALNAVDAIASDDVWAVGYDQSLLQTLTIHWDGSTWSVVSSPSVGTDGSVLTGVSVIAPDDVWAVGYSGSDFSAFLTLTMHWDGSAWNIVSSPNSSVDNKLNGVAGLASDDVWAVGSDNDGSTGNTLTEQWNGSAWNVVASANVSSTSSFMGVAPVSAADAWAVGWEYTGGQPRHTLIERYVNSCQTPPIPTDTATSTPTVSATRTSIPSGTATDTPTPLSTATPIVCDISFPDVPLSSTFYPYIHCLACREIINGYPCGGPGEPCNGNSDPYFRPGNNVTRGQFAKIASNSAGFNEPTDDTQQYEDVVVGATFYDYIWRLTNRDLINGYPCGGPGEPCGSGNLPYFRPSANVTRGQLSKIDANAAGLTQTPGAQQFEDVLPGSTFYDFIWRLTALGYMSGYPCGGVGEPCGPNNRPYFRPSDNATRGQASKIVSNTFFPQCQP